ncbi:hypothetical protein AVEN_196435-1, partial [Araneus ventricosus]
NLRIHRKPLKCRFPAPIQRHLQQEEIVSDSEIFNDSDSPLSYLPLRNVCRCGADSPCIS